MARGDIYEDYDEIEADAQKDRVGDGLVILTTLVLLLAFFMIQKAMNDHHERGMFAEDKPGPVDEAPVE